MTDPVRSRAVPPTATPADPERNAHRRGVYSGRGRRGRAVVLAVVPVVVLAVVLTLAGCSGGGHHGAQRPGTSLGPSGDGGAAGTGATEGSTASSGGAGTAGTGHSGAGGTPGSAGPGGGSGSGGSGGGSAGKGPIVGSPTDPGAGPARPRGWRPLPASPVRGRHSASAVWTGREMIVWGGAWRAGDASIWLDDGAAYDPAGDRWRRIASSPLGPRSEAVIGWTGKEVLVWGGQEHGSLTGFGDELSDGALYDPAKDTWKPMAAWPLAPRYGARAVWTGTRLVVWGGASAEAGDDPPPLADGAAYDPSANHWTKLPAGPLAGRIAPLGGPRGESVLFSWGLGAAQGAKRAAVSDSALFDPVQRRWSGAAAAPPPPKETWCLDAAGCVGVDTGGRVVFAGQGLAWDPGGDRWSIIAAGPFGDPYLEGKAQAWTGTRVMVWGGGTTDQPGDVPPAKVTPGGSAYDPVADRWEPLPTAPLTPRARAMAVWTGRELIIWGGEGDSSHRAQFADGGAYTP